MLQTSEEQGSALMLVCLRMLGSWMWLYNGDCAAYWLPHAERRRYCAADVRGLCRRKCGSGAMATVCRM